MQIEIRLSNQDRELLTKLFSLLEKDKEPIKCATHTLYEEVINDKITSEEVKKECSNPFRKEKRKYYKWTREDFKVLEYCTNPKTALSHRTLAYLKKKLPQEVSYASIRSKLNRLGFKIEQGVICKS